MIDIDEIASAQRARLGIFQAYCAGLSATRWPSPPCWPAAGTGDSHLDRSGRRQPATGFRLSNTGGRFSPLAT
jgi:hypothetical protein